MDVGMTPCRKLVIRGEGPAIMQQSSVTSQKQDVYREGRLLHTHTPTLQGHISIVWHSIIPTCILLHLFYSFSHGPDMV